MQDHPRIKLELRASRRLMALLLCAHALSITTVLVLPAAAGIKFLMVVALLGSVGWYARRHGVPATSPSVDAVELKPDGTAALRTRDGAWHEAQLAPSVFCSPWFTILKFKTQAGRWPRFVVVVPDMLLVDDYRRLQVWLRWGAVVRMQV